MRKEAKTKGLVNRVPRSAGDTSELNSNNASDLMRKRAYELFEMRGRGPCHELKDRLQAEQEINRDLRMSPGSEPSRGIPRHSQ